jgi:hypothetical protein
MTVFGTGVEIDTDFDLSVSEITGSLKLDSGIDVIERDVAFTLARSGGRFRGGPTDVALETGVETAVRQVLSRDPRIITVQNVTVNSQPSAKTIAVDVTVTTASEETEALLIEIPQ